MRVLFLGFDALLSGCILLMACVISLFHALCFSIESSSSLVHYVSASRFHEMIERRRELKAEESGRNGIGVSLTGL